MKLNETTSSEINGYKLDNEKYNIPKFNNIYGIFEGDISKLKIAKEFVKLGWSVRKCSFNDFEIEGKWAEFIIEGKTETLINGTIDTKKIFEFEKILQNIRVKYSIELYDKKTKLIKTVANNQYNQ